jgi:hypothetical protein
MRNVVTTILLATTASAAIYAATPASAQQSHQATDNQTILRHNVQQLPRTFKRDQIIRAELSSPDSGLTDAAGGPFGAGR